jgi:hypothetical protein
MAVVGEKPMAIDTWRHGYGRDVTTADGGLCFTGGKRPVKDPF